MNYDFTTLVDRSGTGSLKWNKYRDQDIVPLWVADMDFKSAPEIIDALKQRADHGVFGYTKPTDEVVTEVQAYLKRMHQQDVAAESLFWLPGIVQGLNLISRAIGEPGDAVMVATPVYPPFLFAPLWSDRKLIKVPLKKEEAEYTLDFEAMEAAITPNTKLFILCNPHNPVGRVFRRSELEQLFAFCEKHDLIICSDEIHCDLLLDDVTHLSSHSFGQKVIDRTVSMFAPSKTYNVPGLACAYAVIPNPELMAKFQKVSRGLITEINAFGYAGCTAAYKYGEPWRQALLKQLRSNRDVLYEYAAEHFPRIEMLPMESTYLAWMDMRALGLDNPVAHFESHGVGLSNGKDFGADGFLRLNFGCPESTLLQGLERMRKALEAV